MPTDLYLAHHGIKGMHWGVRRYQNSDGSYTAEGKKRYSNTIAAKSEKEARLKDYNKAANKRSDYEKDLGIMTPEMVKANQSFKNANDAISLARIRDRVANEDPSKRSKARLADEKNTESRGFLKKMLLLLRIIKSVLRSFSWLLVVLLLLERLMQRINITIITWIILSIQTQLFID